jgi:hypothetical protein
MINPGISALVPMYMYDACMCGHANIWMGMYPEINIHGWMDGCV